MDTIYAILFIVIALPFLYWMVCERRNVKPNCYAAGPVNIQPNHHYYFLAPGEKDLSQEEREAYEILSQTNSGSLWTIAIGEIMAQRSVTEFRKLIDQLYSEGKAFPETMIKIIGQDGWDAVCKCKSFHKR